MSLLLHPDYLANETPSDRGTFTAEEIERQPLTWKKLWKKIMQESERLTSFVNNLQTKRGLNIVLTGAGSSAFVGDTVASSWLTHTSCPTQVIPTTDLVTHFRERVATTKPLLLISFARSGNSPESTAAIQRANELCEEVHHLIITCNAEGKLAQMKGQPNTCVFLLPPEAEDQSLAMTNSFTSMALAATLIPALSAVPTDKLQGQVETLSSYAEHLLGQYVPMLHTIAQKAFSRIVFLGSGSNWGVAKESHLKVQELTNGQVVGKFDSFLGFRHGPKAIINDETLIVYLLSNDKRTNRYERDLIDQVARHDIDLTTVAVAETSDITSNVDFSIQMGENHKLREEFWAILCTLPAQIIGFFKSLMLGYNPDNPSPDGTISRVVEGVTIYNDTPKSVNRQQQL
ncbi:SIS domain-containing protein [Fodinibius sediminis]|uniref:Galactosamine 6-phosphate isomerase AgaS n=1 Tax=Fodinibius sediminis TaxID=1214077 RepID=A0A521BZV0_9BACT|nr:SIS domain-containing protein [Fodinibius sediminis]SMO52732.1 galactosamine 6-phosphate isomerase AgaS [Fodinibius sediminis]